MIQQFEIEETSADKTDSIQTYESKLTDATRSIDEVKRALNEATNKQVASETKVDELQKENERLRQELEECKQSTNDDHESLLQKIKQLEEANAKLQKQEQNPTINETFQRQLSDMSEKLSASNLEITHAKQLSQKEIDNLRSMLRARDDAIQTLQQRLERSTEEMTTLEAEVDTLREQQKLREEKGQGEVGNLWKLNDEMANIIEKQSKKVEDINKKLEKKDEVMKEALEKKDEMIKGVQERLEKSESEVAEQNKKLSQLQKDFEGASEQVTRLKEENGILSNQLSKAEEASLSAAEAESSHHGRVSALECDLAKMKAKIDELNESLSEALEEVESLQADVKTKEERIASLEIDLKDSNSELEKSKSTSGDNSGSFARLRSEIENVTRERVKLESDYTVLKSDLEKVNEQLKMETEKVQTLTEDVEQLNKTKIELLGELKKANDEMNLVDDQIQQLEEENARLKLSNNVSEELREAQQALIALDEEKSGALKDSEDHIKKLSLTLSDCEEQVVAGEAKLNQAIREREFIISDLKKEVAAKDEYATQLKADLQVLQLAVEKYKGSPSKRSFGMAIDPDCDVDSDVEVSKLKLQVSTLEREKAMLDTEFKAKLEDRDQTISSLVMTSSKQESSIASLKKEVVRLQVQLEAKSSSDSAISSRGTTRDAHRKEVESLKSALKDMSNELSRANKKVSKVTQDLECAKDQLSTFQTTQDVADLAGRLAVSDQAQRMIKKDNEEKLRERDSAISNLLQTVRANEKIITSLKSELENCKKNVDETLEENRRLQHESEIFGKPVS